MQSKAGLYGFIAIALALLPAYVHQYATPSDGARRDLAGLRRGDRARAERRQARRRVFVALASRPDRHRDRFAATARARTARWSTSSRTDSSRRRCFLLLGYVEEREADALAAAARRVWAGRIRASPARSASRRWPRWACPAWPDLSASSLILIGVYQAGYVWPAIVALVAIVLASAYMLRLYQDVMNGPEAPTCPCAPI